MFGGGLEPTYQHTVEGTWGQFSTPGGKVAFVLTKARLGGAGVDAERRLTRHLLPVREVLNPEKLDFNQLLQRDLDDHRVATKLIPYLLEASLVGPAFFPPILAVLLPFDGQKPVSGFPQAIDEGLVEENEAKFLGTRYGAAFRVRKLANAEGDGPNQVRLARVSWNDELAKLVVLDGQHRAMALLAVDRTINGTWSSSSGARFRHFYEHRVREHLREARKLAGADVSLEDIEVPVTFCWFPGLHGESNDPHKAARKIFVDVNKEARQPSEARLVLLSDTELQNVFTRSLLNRLRESDPPLPLYAVEYDNPDKESARPVRWSVLTNLNLLKYGVQYCVFGPPKYVHNMGLRFGGRLSEDKMDAHMRQQLNIKDLLPETVDDGERVIDRAAIGNKMFPITEVDTLTHAFLESWGEALLTVLGGLLPYRAHSDALQDLRDSWLADDAMNSLAHEAVFVGVGMYWTLRDSELHWREQVQKAREQHIQPPHKPDIVKAWEVIQGKKADFSTRRAIKYLGQSNEATVARVDQFYEIVNTHACQLGAFLTLASLAWKADLRREQVAEFSKHVVKAWNAALLGEVSASRDRRLVLAREPVIPEPINRIARMDTPLGVFFRYFWLELLCTDEAQEHLSPYLQFDDIRELASKARSHYLAYLVDERAKGLKKSNPTWSQTKIQERALQQESSALRKSLKKWFGWTDDAFNAWLDMDAAEPEPVAEEIAEEGEPPEEGNGDGSDGSDEDLYDDDE